MKYPKHDYKEYPKTLPPDDFWGQVRRTVHGKPLPAEQIELMTTAIRDRLDLAPTDVCLDLACGNGYLSSHLYPYCATLFGVDASPYLIEIAQKNFAIAPHRTFVLDDVVSYLRKEREPGRFTKVLCYGSFSYFSAEDAIMALRLLNRRFFNVERVFIGNLPDKSLADRFFPRDTYPTTRLNDCATQIGIWRTVTEVEDLARRTGWQLHVTRMPEHFYAAHYRFDAILVRIRPE